MEVYTSKVLAEGAVMGMDTIAKLFLTGFGTTALLGPFVGKWVRLFEVVVLKTQFSLI